MITLFALSIGAIIATNKLRLFEKVDGSVVRELQLESWVR